MKNYLKCKTKFTCPNTETSCQIAARKFLGKVKWQSFGGVCFNVKAKCYERLNSVGGKSFLHAPSKPNRVSNSECYEENVR